MRAFFFWTLTLTTIFLGTTALVGSGLGQVALANPLATTLDLSILQDRSAFLGIGLTAVVASYRSAWLAWRKSRQA
jgi:hypothetical protein